MQETQPRSMPHAGRASPVDDITYDLLQALTSKLEAIEAYRMYADDGDRDRLLAESFAALMPGAWPEPFGLVAIEALACGTPILARRVGALPEIIRDGIDGFFGDDPMHLAFLAEGLPRLDRRAIRERVIERFSAARMADRYEELFVRLVAGSRPDEPVALRHPSPRPAAGAGEPRIGSFAELAAAVGVDG